jgi:hypothetical protein
VLGALAAVAGPLFAPDGRAAWLVLGAVTAAALVAAGVRLRRPWVAAVGTGGVFLSVPLAVAELFDARLGPLVGILAVGLAQVGAAVVLHSPGGSLTGAAASNRAKAASARSTFAKAAFP